VADNLREKPCPPISFVDSILNPTGGGRVIVAVADFVSRAKYRLWNAGFARQAFERIPQCHLSSHKFGRQVQQAYRCTGLATPNANRCNFLKNSHLSAGFGCGDYH
jgi:hypothetical protein